MSHSSFFIEVDDNPKAKWKLPLLSEKEYLQKQLEKFENIYQKLEGEKGIQICHCQF